MGQTPTTGEVAGAAVRPLDATDHVRGNPNAPIVFIEYSDFDCPFCKLFHETMRKVMDKYGTSGKVAWVYRNLPIKQLHPNAPKLAEAAECVAELGGNDAFWKFADLVFGERETNAQTDMTKLPSFAQQAGVDKAKYEECFNSGKHAATVTKSIDEFIKISGGKVGTPHTFVLVGDQSAVIEGAQPYEFVEGLLENIIAQMNGAPAPSPTGAPAAQ